MSQRSKAIKKAVADRKEQLKPKRTPTFKQFENKFKEKIVDVFGESNQSELQFNRAPVVEKKTKFQNAKKEKKTKKSIFQDRDEESEDLEYFEQQNKKVKTDKLFDDDDTFFNSFNADFKSFFQQAKGQMMQLSKIPAFKYEPGTLVLGAICDKGANNKYIVMNLSRNKKAYVSETDNQKCALQNYQISEYCVGVVVFSENLKKIQVSLQPSLINNGISFEDIVIGQVLVGQVVSIEDYGVKFQILEQDNLLGFVKNEEMSETDLNALCVGKQQLLRIQSLNHKQKMLYCQYASKSQQPMTLKDKGEEFIQSGQIDIQHLVKPGNLVKVIVQKIVENGLIVKFLNFFYGFIFIDHLTKKITKYEKGEKFNARIIALDYENKKIQLSENSQIVQFTQFDTSILNYKNGQIFQNGFTISQNLFGGSYKIGILDEQGKNYKQLNKFENLIFHYKFSYYSSIK